MTRLLILSSHGLDLLTLLVVAASLGIGGEGNPFARSLYASAGPLGLIAFKTIGAGLLVLIAGRSQLRLALAVLAGLAGALVNGLAWRMT